MSTKEVKIVSLRTEDELPSAITPYPSEKTLEVQITYKRVIGQAKTEHGLIPVYGGAMASYPRRMDFHLDRATLL